MLGKSDWTRGKLLDYWVRQCTDGKVTEEEMERQMDRLAEMSPDQLTREYGRRIVSQRVGSR